MKILVLSDSHRRVAALLTATERERPDYIFHLGDLVSDAGELSDAYPQYPIAVVAGNCDGWNIGPSVSGTLEQTVGGVKFLLTHGHLYRAKMGAGALLKEGRHRGMDAVLYGHTHVPKVERQEDGLWLINPGTAGGVGNRATYAVIEAQDGALLSAEIKNL